MVWDIHFVVFPTTAALLYRKPPSAEPRAMIKTDSVEGTARGVTT
jgi:hypothetical protein